MRGVKQRKVGKEVSMDHAKASPKPRKEWIEQIATSDIPMCKNVWVKTSLCKSHKFYIPSCHLEELFSFPHQ